MRQSLPIILSITLLIIVVASPATAETITIAESTPFSETSGVTENVKNECGIQVRLPKYIKSYAKKHTDVVFTTEPLENAEGKFFISNSNTCMHPVAVDIAEQSRFQ